MKMICDVPDEVIKCIKDGMWCGSHIAEKMITNGIPLNSMEEPCEDAISRQAAKKALEDRFIELQKRHDDKRYETNYCLNTILELPSVNPQKPKSEWEHDHEILKAYSDGANEVLDKIRAEIEELAKPNEFGGRGNGKSVRYGLCKALEIIDKYMAEGSGEE